MLNFIKKHRTAVAVATILLGIVGVAGAPTAQAAVNYFDQTKTVTGYGSVSCGSGWKVTGGGVKPPSSNAGGTYTGGTTYEVTSSYPSSNTWRGTATKIEWKVDKVAVKWSSSGSPTAYAYVKGIKSATNYTPTVYAICTR